MRSAGNDIVALGAIDCQRTRSSRFYSKIIAEAEQLIFDRLPSGTLPFENFVWLLWSVKESVYKYLKRTNPALVFAPTKIRIRGLELPLNSFNSLLASSVPSSALPEKVLWEERETGSGDACYKGGVFFESYLFYYRSWIFQDCIVTIVNNEESFEDIWWGVQAIDRADYRHQSRAVRSFALNRLNKILLPKEGCKRVEMPPIERETGAPLRIGKSAYGYPVLLQGEMELAIPISFAHHGNFIAYSFHLPSPLN